MESMRTGIRNQFRKMSLVQKFSAAVIFLILVVMIVVNTLIITHQRKTLRSEMDGNNLVLAKKLSQDVVEHLISMDPLSLDDLVRTMAQTPACTYAGVIDRDGRIVAHTNRKMLGRSVSGGMQRLFADTMKKGEAHARELPGSSLNEIAVPVRAGYEALGVVVAGFSQESMNAAIENSLRGLKRYITAVSLAVLVIGIWGAYGLARFLATPMRKLRDNMELVQDGNLNVEISSGDTPCCSDILSCGIAECPAYGRTRCWTIPGTRCFGHVQGAMADKMSECRSCIVYKESCGDEIGELIEGFNQMVRRLSDSIRELEAAGNERARLEKLSALGEMSMTVAHEIKNPLNSIRGAASYLRDNFEGEILKEFLSIIEEETSRLNEIVTSILRYSKPTPLKLERSDINRLVRDTVELIRQEATEGNIDIVTALDEKLPPFAFDRQQLKQALLNILVNALDVTETGGSIRISTEGFDSRIRIVIKDTGAGMSEETVSEIFKPFFTTKTRGSGLGLACVERIVKDHRGDIAVRSEIGKGTEFIITMPLGN